MLVLKGKHMVILTFLGGTGDSNSALTLVQHLLLPIELSLQPQTPFFSHKDKHNYTTFPVEYHKRTLHGHETQDWDKQWVPNSQVNREAGPSWNLLLMLCDPVRGP